MKIVIISGFFDPIHVGHIDYINEARELGDKLIVIVNTDFQAKLKKGKSFMQEQDRIKIINNIKAVDESWLSADKDMSVCKTLGILNGLNEDNKLIFANGGDRKAGNIPEYKLAKKLGIKLEFNVGGEKTRSSSELIKNMEKTE